MSSLFGLDPTGCIVYISEVPRGLACQCRCVACGEPLIARQGAVREHHFAHASGREPCDVSHESLLHRYAKQVIQEAGALLVPVDDTVQKHLGFTGATPPSAKLELLRVEVECSVQELRPDLLAYTCTGLQVAIEVAYSSFCDPHKVQCFAQLGLPALEIDLRAFSPESFEPVAVRAAVLDDIQGKAWLWPKPLPEEESTAHPLPTPPTSFAIDTPRLRLPEEIVTISGRWVSIKEFPSGDIAVKVITYDPDVVSLVKTIAKASYARYSPRWKSWNVPRWRADVVREELRRKSSNVSIVLKEG